LVAYGPVSAGVTTIVVNYALCPNVTIDDYALPSYVIKGGCGISGLYDLAPLPYTFVQSSLQLTWDQVLRNSPILHLPLSPLRC
jgi:hypothetical protein